MYTSMHLGGVVGAVKGQLMENQIEVAYRPMHSWPLSHKAYGITILPANAQLAAVTGEAR